MKRIIDLRLAALIASGLLLAGIATCAHAAPPRLKVSENRRFLAYEDGRPFFYLGDTAWELFHRLDRDEARHYLSTRAKQGFTVIQAVALAEEDGLNVPNAYGHRPLLDHDPARPDERPGPDNDYWDHVDFIVDAAAEQGLVVGLLPTWGDKWNKKWGVGPEIFHPENARIYGRWLGKRYADKPVLWILGGDRPVENDQHRALLRAMAEGIREGDQGRGLMTFHPTGGRSSSDWAHEEPWLDFNMRQNGHTLEYQPRYAATRADYDRVPTKPVIDGEPIYEDHPVNFKAADFGHSTANDVRRPLYWDLFSGAFGHTYGHHSMWQFFSARTPPKNHPLLPWTEAIHQAGAEQMKWGRRLIESRPFFSRVPDDSVIVPGSVPTSVPGAGRYRFVATRDRDGTYAFVYAPVGRAFKVRMNVITGPQVQAWWFNPRTGEATSIGIFANEGEREFQSPDKNEDRDWILVLDDAARKFSPPGTPAPK